MKYVAIAPSMMCADLTDLRSQVQELECAGVDYLHIDVMDGHFVPNLMLSSPYVQALRKLTDLPMDYHFMVERPENMLSWFDIRPGDLCSIHLESTPHINRALQQLRSRGAKVLVAINPATPVCMLDSLWEEIDGVLVMTVNPGYAGQKLVDSTLEKIAQVKQAGALHGKSDMILEVDGNVNYPNAAKMGQMGANLFVAGSSGLFRGDCTVTEGIARLRSAVNGN